MEKASAQYFEIIDIGMERSQNMMQLPKMQKIEDEDIEFPTSICVPSTNADVPFFEEIDAVLVKTKMRNFNVYNRDNKEKERYYR